MATTTLSASNGNSSSQSSIQQKDTTLTKIFVGGLPYHTTDASLKAYFEQYGEIEEAVVITDRQTGKSRGYGFVTMKRHEDACQAIRDPNPCIDGRKANVNLAVLGAKPRTLPGLPTPLAALGRVPGLLPQTQTGVSPLSTFFPGLVNAGSLYGLQSAATGLTPAQLLEYASVSQNAAAAYPYALTMAGYGAAATALSNSDASTVGVAAAYPGHLSQSPAAAYLPYYSPTTAAYTLQQQLAANAALAASGSSNQVTNGTVANGGATTPGAGHHTQQLINASAFFSQ